MSRPDAGRGESRRAKEAEELRPGLVIHARGSYYEVLPADGEQVVLCLMRGRLKKDKRLTDLVVAGDHVRWRPLGAKRGAIEEVLPRETVLSRPRPRLSGVEDVIIANLDQAVFIFSVCEPEPNLRLLDRLLVVAEHNDLPAVICANKVDLLEADEDPAELFGVYEAIGYPVIYTSADTGQGVDTLRGQLRGRLSVLTGPSGVGKTSLLNAIQPELGLATHQVSYATGKGRHTTVAVHLFPLEEGGFVADTPGLREMGLWEIEPHMLDWLFPEFRPFLGLCRFSSCAHLAEPACAVIAAVEAGAIDLQRYDSYCRLREKGG